MVTSQLARHEMTNPLRRRMFSAQLVPVSIALLLVFVSDMRDIRGVHCYGTLSTETFICNGTEPCVHQAQQGNSVTTNNLWFRETVDIPVTSMSATGIDLNDPCPTIGLLDSGARPKSIGTEASRQIICQ
jgi:hypothetical protein